MSVDAPTLQLTPDSNGMLLMPDEFDSAEGERGWRYELIRGVVIVSPAPSPQERDPNAELEFLLRYYQRSHPNGSSLDKTLPEHDIHVGNDRRRADRAIWAGLGRRPRIEETPTIAVEFVSEGKRNRQRDYVEKRDEYLGIGVKEYWIIDRFTRTMTVHSAKDGGKDTTVIEDNNVYTTAFLPGFELPLGALFDLADEWDG